MKKIKAFVIIFFSVYSLFFVAGSLLAPIMAHFGQYELSSQLTVTFMYSCHQKPDRSFWILGYPVALCCRCLGFYTGVAVSGFMTAFNKLKMPLKLYIILFLLAAIDIALNYLFKISTANIVRFSAGIIMGFLFISTLFYIFEKGEKLWDLKN